MQLGQTSTSELLPAAETSQENVVRNISHLLREPHARQCLRQRVKHLNQTPRTESADTSTTSFNKNPPKYCQGLSMFPVPDNKIVRNCKPLARVGTSQPIFSRARRAIDKPRATTKQSASSTMEHVRANGLAMCRDRGQARAIQSFKQACATEHTYVARQHLYSSPQI